MLKELIEKPYLVVDYKMLEWIDKKYFKNDSSHEY